MSEYAINTGLGTPSHSQKRRRRKAQQQYTTWEQIQECGVHVTPEDQVRPIPALVWVGKNVWRTQKPPVDEEKLPRPHDPTLERDESKRIRKDIDRLGRSKVNHMCDENRAAMTECMAPCDENTPLTQGLPTTFVLKYFAGRQWGLLATKIYAKGDHIAEYVGEVVDWEGGAKRNNRPARAPSYMHTLREGEGYSEEETLFVDAEHFGNALRFVNHACVGPNCRFEFAWVQGQPRLQVSAYRDIVIGEEFTASYGFRNHPGSMCHCGHILCRGFMGKEIITELVHGKRVRIAVERSPIALELALFAQHCGTAQAAAAAAKLQEAIATAAAGPEAQEEDTNAHLHLWSLLSASPQVPPALPLRPLPCPSPPLSGAQGEDTDDTNALLHLWSLLSASL